MRRILVALVFIFMFLFAHQKAKVAYACPSCAWFVCDCGCGCGHAGCDCIITDAYHQFVCCTSSNPACACPTPTPNPCAGNTTCGQCGNPPCCVPNCSGYQCGQGNGCGGGCGNGDAFTGCTPACGQNSVCGNFCGTSGLVVPGVIPWTNPANGGSVTTVGTQATVSWGAATNANKYDFHLYPTANPVCTDPRAYCTDVASGGGLVGTSYTFTPQANAYSFTIRPVNTTCNAYGKTVNGSWTGTPLDFKIVANITGTVYNDPAGLATLSGGSCIPNGGPGTGIQPGAGSTVITQDASGSHAPVSVAANGTYTAVGLLNANTSVTLNPGDVTYACTCPVGCSFGGVLPPKTGVNFYVSQIGGNWFQIMGGDVNTSGQGALTFKDPITSLCSGSCQPYPLVAPAGQTPAQVGSLLSYQGSNIDVSDIPGNQASPVGPPTANYPVKTNSSLACKENYDYFYRLYSLGNAPQEDFVAPQNNPSLAHKPDQPPVNTTAGAYYRGGDLIIDRDWTLGPTESMVIFITGGLTITNNAHITVPQGAFLAFIVKGDIAFGPTIGTTPSSTTGVVQGVYIANGNITVQSVGANPTTDEKKFTLEGTMSACGNISLPRDFRNATTVVYGLNNNSYPSSLFIFRPDILLNTPEKMKRPLLNWKEVAP